MRDQQNRDFTLADVIDYELQMTLDSRARPEDLVRRDQAIRLDSSILKQGKVASLKAWLQLVRGPTGKRFFQVRQLLSLTVIAVGALLGWGTIRGLLTYDGHHPVNVLPFLAIFVLLPLFFLALLFFKGMISRFLGRLPGGWVSYSGQWIVARVTKKNQLELPALDLWERLQALHPGIFTLQAWILSQSFGLAYYLSSLASFLFYVSVNDYAFAWQTTLRMGPDALGQLVTAVAWPFAWLGSVWVPDTALIQATQYERFSGTFAQSQGSSLAADWWPFLAAVMFFYGALPRLILLLIFQTRLRQHLRRLTLDDFASEEVWLRLQTAGLGWTAEKGTQAIPVQPLPQAITMKSDQPLFVVRWRQAPFSDDVLRTYFARRGYTVGSITDAEGRESEFKTILDGLQGGQALALVCDPWELPGEAFNRLRLAMREKMLSRTPIFLVPLQEGAQGIPMLSADRDRDLWETSLKAFRDPYIGLLHDGSQNS